MLKDITISKGILDFYNQSSEEQRLSAGLGPLEFERNKDLIGRFLPRKSCRVVDVGGGTGKYSEWLAREGHQELTSGMHNAPESMPGILAEAYYHKPEELKSEFEECKLVNLKLFAVEGMIWLDKNFFSSRGDQKKNENLLKLIRITENDINLISFSPHMMVAAIKQ